MRIAVIKLSALGDVTHALPVAAALRERFPEARLTWVAERRETALLRGHPALDDVIAVDTRRWRQTRGAAAWRATAREIGDVLRCLRRPRVDVALDLQGLIKSGLVTAATGARVRIGFAARCCREPLNAVFTNRRLAPAPEHIVDQQLALLAPLGILDARAAFWLPADAESAARAEAFLVSTGLASKDRLIVLNPGAGRSAKKWPVAHFAALATRLLGEASAHVLVVWGPGERSDAEAILAGVRGQDAVLAPPTDLRTLLALLRRASVVVAGDTGPLHLAAALGTPCVGLYGPTSAIRNGPYGAGHRALQSPDGTMKGLSPEAVFLAVSDSLRRIPSGRG
jgi:lipopolysaccharide heptosyltransferase I